MMKVKEMAMALASTSTLNSKHRHLLLVLVLKSKSRIPNSKHLLHTPPPPPKLIFFSSFCTLKTSSHDNISHKPPPPANARLDSSLKVKMEEVGIDISCCKPGEYTHMLCPMCNGGQTLERTLSLHINLTQDFSMWRCFRITCGWAGRTFADDKAAHNQSNVELEPLGHKLIAYFAERKISEETLKRNGVMQVFGDQNVVAFPYRKDGAIVGCKYRTIDKRRFWQQKGTEKAFYGLDDIKESAEIIIVEGEIDKLSMEEAGFKNCVSVPNGAPQKVSSKELPPLEKDTAFQYLWNSKEYFDKASRIILATDGDFPGQALAKELARRLGKERCWQVIWPKKDDSSYFKDANEVLKMSSADSLKEIIATAKMHQHQLHDSSEDGSGYSYINLVH